MQTLPFVSLIMPVRNEADFIERSLGAVLAQDYPKSRLEIIIVDGMSTDGTREKVLAHVESSGRLRLISNPGRIVPTGLNLAIAEARGDIIIRVDGHCEIAPDYASRCVQHLQSDDVDCVGGPIETIGETPIARTIALAMSSRFGVGGSTFRTVNDKAMIVDTVAFPAYTRQVLELAGGFDEELVRNQDDEYNYRLRKLGRRILLSPDIRSRYYSRGTVRSLWRQYFQYGYWKVRVLQKHTRQMQPRQFAPGILVSTLSMALLLSPFLQVARWSFLLVAFAYLLANIAASVSASRSEGWKQRPLLSLCFATLHFSYGFGFVYGLVRFWNRWGDNGSRSTPALKLEKQT